MHLGALAAAVLILASPASAGAPPDRLKRNLEIEGYHVQVVVKGRHARAHQRGMLKIHGITPELRAVLIEAIQRVTGCTTPDPYFDSGSVVGLLECPAATTAPSP